MATISIHWDNIAGLKRFENGIKSLEKDGRKVMQRALARVGDKARTQVYRSLTKQTGLERKVIVKAVKTKRPSWTDLSYTMTTEGGDISLKYFKPIERKKGVVAKPFGKSTTFAGSFLKGGKWPNRAGQLAFGGHAFHRVGSSRFPVEMTKSRVVIPDEMVKGATAEAFDRIVRTELPKRVEHELGRLLK